MLFLAITCVVHAQKKQVTGVVKDNIGEPLPGASIVVKGTANGVTSDFDGNFTISASSSGILVISYIGYKSLEVVVGNNNAISVVLEADVASLDEVVVVGYGTQKKKDLSGAVSTVSGEALSIAPTPRRETPPPTS